MANDVKITTIREYELYLDSTLKKLDKVDREKLKNILFEVFRDGFKLGRGDIVEKELIG